VLGHLAADLRGDRAAGRLEQRGRADEGRRGEQRRVAGAEQRAERGQPAEGDRAAEQAPGANARTPRASLAGRARASPAR
jgi:hypothetical protein